MISIINIITPIMINNQMINNIITIVFLIIIFSLRYIMGGIAAKKNHTRILVQNLNLVSIPLIIVSRVINSS